jgi:hypothetical protein
MLIEGDHAGPEYVREIAEAKVKKLKENER